MSWLKSAVGRSKAAGHDRLPPLNSRLGDWTGDFRDVNKYAEGFLDQLTLPGEISAMAYEPGMGYLAVGTSAGTVHLFGSPCVRMALTLRPALRVKHILFKSDTYLMICIDEKDNLNVYDLSRRDPHAAAMHGARRAAPGQTQMTNSDAPMRIGIHSARNVVLCAEVTSIHSMLFLGLTDGSVEAYDLERFCGTQYRIPNLWWNEEEILRRSQVPNAPSRLHTPLIIDIQTHPRDPGILLLCYEGGAVIYSIRQSTAIHVFQLRLLPGAPGPVPSAPLEEVWSERLCPATAISWSPCGTMFVMGHENGALSFWHIAEEDKPLMVRTLDDIDIDRPVLPEQLPKTSAGPREPIFKLTWSSFPEQGWYEYGAQAAGSWAGSGTAQANTSANHGSAQNGTVLTVMGGTPVDQPATSLHTFHFPPTPAASFFSASASDASARARTALRDSLQPTYVGAYRTASIVEDFCLLPRLSPHFGGTHDPYAILVLVGQDASLPSLAVQSTRRGMDVFSFPPLQGPHSYERLSLPLPLAFSGRGTILGCHMATVPVMQYRRLVQQAPNHPLGTIKYDQPMGGVAKPQVQNAKLMHAQALAQKGQPRILITWHLDGRVRLHDVSPHLLLLGEEDSRRGVVLVDPFPTQLSHLTLHVRDHVLHPSMFGMPALDTLQRFPMQIQIDHVQVAWDSLECVVSLTTGHALHYVLGSGTVINTTTSPLVDAMHQMRMDDSPADHVTEFTSLEPLANHESSGFQPNTLMSLLPGSPTCSALSDVGLYACAYGGMLVVADCRSHDIVVRAGSGNADFFSRQLGSREAKIIEHESSSEIVWQRFSVCRTVSDSILALRLLVGRANGFVTVWSFERGSLESWMGFRSDAMSLGMSGRPVYVDVVGSSGAVASATEHNMQRAELDQAREGVTSNTHDFYLLLAVYPREARLYDQVTGQRFAQADWPDPALSACIIERQNARMLAVIASNSVFILSLPRLDTVHRVQRHVPPDQEVVAATPRISLERQGDFIEITSGQQLRLWTVFGSLPHGEMPSMFLYTPRSLPLPPGAGASGYIASVASWLGSSAGQSLSAGAQIDTIICGKRRAKLPPLPPRMTLSKDNENTPIASSITEQGAGAKDAPTNSTQTSASGSWLGSYQRQFLNFASSSARAQAQLNMQLLHKRDEILSDLDESMTNLERGAKDFFKQTRNSALKAAAKDKIKTYL